MGTMPVSVMQNTLTKYGVPPSPMEKFALTAYAATRDVSMRAQAKEEFLKLDPATQAKLKKLGKEVVVRAASIDPEDLAGVTEPLGFWDPAGFSENGNVAAYRRAELKHGRVCMQAALDILCRRNSTRSSMLGVRAHTFQRLQLTSRRPRGRTSGPPFGLWQLDMNLLLHWPTMMAKSWEISALTHLA